MNTKELLKKYWFVCLVAVLAVIFIVYYAVVDAQNKPKTLATKQEDGQYLIYTAGEDKLTADQLYEELYDQMALTMLYRQLDRAVIDASYETTSEMKNIATNSASYLLTMYSKEQLDSDLRSLGYSGVDELDEYYIYMQKATLFARDYFNAHLEDIVEPYIAENNSKVISHILVLVDNVETVTNADGTTTLVAHPTEEEQAKLDEVQAKLANGEDFAEVAKTYSDDSSASNGGSLGYYDTSVASGYVAEFTAAADPLKEGDVTEPVLSTYGYHIIRCDASTTESLMNNDDFINKLVQAYNSDYTKAIYEKSQELGYKIEDEAMRTEIESVLNGDGGAE
ncbi:MAG: peptidylprolyl isomerase [Erysipelotrichaceae bacterium]|nr:peptidylprolyl isomerase [Erysipelotrichaceae bacterium]